ncbi:lysophospholipid acyltransferase family protein [Nocardioides sp. Bht2]|uniref:lysophospholipid acyltransferase family protein n=1 Tax=Nocardioides sp. Bht2 TaxID=3392297 RepID=UPI0039B52778
MTVLSALTRRGVHLAGSGLLRALGHRVEVWEPEHLPKAGPALIAATHVSYPDFIMVQAAAGARQVRFLARHDAWEHRIAGPILKSLGHIPVDRAAPAGAYLEARRALASGDVVGLFPEAGISYSFTVRALMQGAVALARDTGVPVIPTALWGSQRIYTVGRPVDGVEPPPDWARGRRIDVWFGAPITVAPHADPRAETVRLGERLTAMLEGLQGLPHHRPQPGEAAPWYPAHLGGSAPDLGEAATLDVVPRSAVRPTWGPSAQPHDGLSGGAVR